MQNKIATSTAQFTDKYEKSGRIGHRLVNHFLHEVSRLIPSAATKLIEVGCGAGYSTAFLANAHPDKHWEAVDVDPELVTLAQARNPGIAIRVGSVYELPHEDKSVDCSVCLEVLEHLDDPARALRELARITKSSVVLSVPREPMWRMLNMLRGKYLNDLGNTPGHLNHWSTREFVKFVGREFEIEAVATPLPWTIVRARPRP